MSQGRLNVAGIRCGDETWYLYRKNTRETIGYISKVNNSYVFKTRDNLNAVVRLTRIDDVTYQAPVSKVMLSQFKGRLSIWHARLRHLNYSNLKQHLRNLKIDYYDDLIIYCEACELGKATKIYNRSPQKGAVESFEYTHTDMVSSIKSKKFLDEEYFFTFTDDLTRFTHIYTARNRHE